MPLAARTYEDLNGAEKAAVLMLAVREDLAARLFARLDIEEVVEISQTMSGLGRVDAGIVEPILREFGERLDGDGGAGAVVGGFDATEKMLLRFMEPARVETIMEGIRGPAGRTVWDKLANVDEGVLAAYLKNEYPQTVAVVLSRLESSHAARVLAHLSDEQGLEVVMRMLQLEVVQKDVLADVERTLSTEFMTNLARTNRRDNHEIMAEIFNHLDRGTETRLMGSLEECSKETAERIRSHMFTFEDLVKLDGPGVQTLVRAAGNDRLGIALKGAGERVRELFYANMSERAAKILREDMAASGPVRLRDVEEAQQFLVNLTKELAASGEIVLAAGGADEQLVY